MCGHENEPNIFLNVANMAGGPVQLVTIALAIYNKNNKLNNNNTILKLKSFIGTLVKQ